MDARTEFEYGVSDSFQLALYLHYTYINASENSVRGKTEGIEIPFDHDSSKPYSRVRWDGLELRLILQKNFMDDLLVVDANFWVEYEREKGAFAEWDRYFHCTTMRLYNLAHDVKTEAQ